MPDSFLAPEFWAAVLQIILIDVVLSGDNAVVIALACRNLPPEQRRSGIFWGVAGAVGLRVVLTMAAALVMNLPWLKLVGGLLLLWIGVKLLAPDGVDAPGIPPAGPPRGAGGPITVADFVMSLGNVIGVAGASHGNLFLLLFGLLVSIPLIIGTSQMILRLMERWPVVVVVGAALLGWVAGSMIWSDPALADIVANAPAGAATVAAALPALLVVVIGKWLERRSLRQRDLTIE